MAKRPTDHGSARPQADGLGDDFLGGVFEAAQRDAHANLAADLEARILMQAAQVQAGFTRERASGGMMARWQRVWADLGGWPVITGVATATVAGLWLGIASPTALDSVWSGVGLTSASLDGDFPDYDAFFEEI